jgi:NAD(P)-dependent dehydrogenase (short-subunit alcohol dehydrogenase family)
MKVVVATLIVTGANNGLGYEAVRHLIQLFATKVILTVRCIIKGEESKAKTKIEDESGVKSRISLGLITLLCVRKFEEGEGGKRL